MNRFVSLALLVALASPAFAGDKKPKDPNDPKVCKNAPGGTGSLISRGRECHLQSEWAAMEAATAGQAKNFMDGLSYQKTNLNGSGGGATSGIPVN